MHGATIKKVFKKLIFKLMTYGTICKYLEHQTRL